MMTPRWSVRRRGTRGRGNAAARRADGRAEGEEESRPAAEASPDRTVFLDWEVARVNFFRGLSDAEAREFYEKLTPQPIDVYVEPARVCVRDLGTPVRYLGFTRDAAITPERAAGFARKAGVSIEMMESAHGAMLTHPLELAEQLIAGLP